MGYSLGAQETRAIDGAPTTQVLAGTIVIPSTVNAGNAMTSTAKAPGVLGVTYENTDPRGYAGIMRQPGNIVDCIAGTGGVAIGNIIASDANGHGVPVTPLYNGTTLTQVVGVAETPAAAGATFKLLFMPTLATS